MKRESIQHCVVARCCDRVTFDSERGKRGDKEQILIQNELDELHRNESSDEGFSADTQQVVFPSDRADSSPILNEPLRAMTRRTPTHRPEGGCSKRCVCELHSIISHTYTPRALVSRCDGKHVLPTWPHVSRGYFSLSGRSQFDHAIYQRNVLSDVFCAELLCLCGAGLRVIWSKREDKRAKSLMSDRKWSAEECGHIRDGYDCSA